MSYRREDLKSHRLAGDTVPLRLSQTKFPWLPVRTSTCAGRLSAN